MQCPSCGFTTWREGATICENCALPLPTSHPPTDALPPPVAIPPPSPATPPATTPEALTSLSASSAPPASAAAPSAPPVAPAAYGAFSPTAPQQPYLSALSPLPPARKQPVGRRIGLIVASIAAIVVVCVGGVAALNYTRNQFGAPASTPQSLPTASVLPSESVVYQSSLADYPPDWANDHHCHAGSDGYYATDGYVCNVPAGDQPDVDVRVRVSQTSGPTTDGHGIAFRITDSDGQLTSGYIFLVTANSAWAVLKCPISANCYHLMDFTPNSVILGGLNTPNTIEVRATKSQFIFIANGTQLGEVSDGDFTSGKVGLFASQGTECVFTDLVLARPES